MIGELVDRIEREIEKAESRKVEADEEKIYYLAWFYDGYAKGLKKAVKILKEMVRDDE